MTDSQPSPQEQGDFSSDEQRASAKRLNRVTPEVRDQLVAYLDGECDEKTSRSLDQLLASNEVARREVDRLSKVYELLDFLPEAAASTEFTQATMKSVESLQPVKNDTQVDVLERIAPFAPVAKTVALSFACTLVGLFAGQLAFASSSDDLLKDVEVIEKLGPYRAVQEPEFVDWISTPSAQNRLREASDGR